MENEASKINTGPLACPTDRLNQHSFVADADRADTVFYFAYKPAQISLKELSKKLGSSTRPKRSLSKSLAANPYAVFFVARAFSFYFQ